MNSVFFPNYSLGKNSLDTLSKTITEVGSNVFIIGGKTALSKSLSKIKSCLESSNIKIVATEIYGHECTYQNMELLKEIGLNCGADIILGVGGGKAVDTAKGVAFKLSVPIITIPTIASNCAGITSLSVVYNENGAFDSFMQFEKPVYHCFMDTDIIANAPFEYLRAGIGDTLAKHYECALASRDDKLCHSDALGLTISKLCVDPLLMYGNQAIADVKSHKDSFELQEAILAIVITTGLVSILVEEKYNGAVAHSVFYGFTTIPNFEENYLHGDAVAFGVLTQLTLEKRNDELLKIRTFLQEIGSITKLSDMKIPLNRNDLEVVLEEIITGPDMDYIPIIVTKEDVYNAFVMLENL